MTVTKNCLSEVHVEELNCIMSAYLDPAANRRRASRRQRTHVSFVTQLYDEKREWESQAGS